MKKLTAVLQLIILITAITLPPLPAAAEGENLFVNGGFEDKGQTTGGAADWYPYSGSWTSGYASYETQNAHSGGACVRINSVSDKKPYVSQSIKNLSVGEEYTLEFYIRATRIGGEGFAVKLEHYGDTSLTGVDTNTKKVWPINEWQLYSQKFRVGEGVNKIVFYLRLYGTGEVFVDDVSLIKTGGRWDYELKTDEVFYYTGRAENGMATVRLNTEYYPEAANGTVDFYFKNKTHAMKSQSAVPFISGVACFEYPMSLFEEKRNEYSIEAIVRGPAGETVKTLTQSVFRYDRPKRLRNDGVYIKKNGVPINPVIAYHVSLDDYKYCAAAGINVVQVGYWYCDYESDPSRINMVLQELKKYDLMGIICLYRGMVPAGHDYNVSNTQRLVTAIAGNENVFAYCTMDEPVQQNKIDPEPDLYNSYRIIRDIDSEIPVLSLDCLRSVDEYKKAVKYCDVFVTDPYPAGNGEPAVYPAEHVRRAREASSFVKPTYALLQAFDWRGYFPTSDEIRHMAYQSLFAGAKGIGYYSIDGASGELDLYNTDRWQGLCDFADQELSDAFSYFVHGGYQKTAGYRGEDAWYEMWRKDGDDYLIILNRSNEEKSIQIPLSSYGFSAEVIAGGEPGVLEAQSNTLVHNLTPRQAVLYKITPQVILNSSFERDTAGWTVSSVDYVKGVYDSEAVGEKCIRLTKVAGDTADISQAITLEGGYYKLGFRFKSGGSAMPVVGTKYTVSAEDTRELSFPAPNTWTDYSIIFNVPQGLISAGNVVISLKNETNGKSVYYDNLSIEKMPDESKIAFYKDGNELEAIEGGKIRVYYYHIPDGRQEGVTLLAGLYTLLNQKEMLVGIGKIESSPEGVPIELETYIDVPDPSGGYYIKVFYVNNLADLKPYKGKVIFK